MRDIKAKYYAAIEDLHKRIIKTQNENIEKAGEMIAKSVAAGGCVSVFDSGHLINSELINRAGGLNLIRKFEYKLNVDNNLYVRDRSEIDKSMEGLAGYALKMSGMKKGDVLIIGSVSGKTENVIDLAVEAKKFGINLITLSSIEYSSSLEVMHPSKKHLYELGDINIDNCAPFGDAMIEFDKDMPKMLPASGLAAGFIMWSVVAHAVDCMLEMGVKPGILKSVNFPPNVEFNKGVYDMYNEKGI